MQHHRAQQNVELCIGEWQRLDKPVLEDNLDPGLPRLFIGPCEHLRRGVNPVHRARRPDLLLGRDRKGAGSAAHIQDLLARRQAGETKNSFSKTFLSTERQQPQCEVVECRPVKNQARRTECLFWLRSIGQFALPLRSLEVTITITVRTIV